MVPFYLQYIANGKVQAPVEKYVMAKLIKLAGGKFYFEGSEKAIAKKVGVADKTVSKLLDYWVSEGVLDKGPAGLQKGRGRPGSKYGLRPNKMPFKAATHSSRIEGLLSALVDNLAGLDREKKYAGGDHKLTYSPRVLLMVLLAHADNCGVVRYLGYADLAERTGLSRQGVMNHLERLKQDGYIRAVVSGLTSSHLFGKTKSVYFLNLNHKAYGELRRQGLLTIYQGFEQGPDLQEGARLIEAAIALKKGALPWNVKAAWGRLPSSLTLQTDWLPFLEKFHDFFIEQHTEQYLQLKLDEYASRMLSEGWGNLQRMIDDQRLRRSIRSDLVPLQDLIALKGDKPEEARRVTEDQVKYLVEAIAIVSYQIAISIQKLVPKDGTRYWLMDHSLLPLPGNREKRASFTLMSFPKKGFEELSRGIKFVRHSKAGERKEAIRESEEMLDTLDLLDYGLRCMPDSKARTWKDSKFKKKKESEKAK